MRTLRTLLLTTVVAASLAAMTSAATAATVNISPGGAFTATSANTLTFTGGGFTITCPFTLNGTLARSVIGAPNTDIAEGSITGATSGPCTGANGISFLNFAWGLLVRIILNADGSITIILRIRAVSILLSVPLAGSCLYSGDLTSTATTRSNPETLSTLTFPAQSIPKTSGGILCPSTGSISGTVAIAPAKQIIIIL